MQNNGVLAPAAIGKRFTLERTAPAAHLVEIVDRFWSVRWDLEEAHEQETLPFPCVDFVVGDHRPGLHGPIQGRFVARLEGRGWVFGTMFRSAGFYALLRPGTKMADLVDRSPRLPEVVTASAAAEALETTLTAANDHIARVALVSAFLRAHHPGVSAEGREANRIVELCRTTPDITRVGQLSERVGRSVRALERSFRFHVGLAPKAIIRRFRIQEAASRLAAGEATDLAALAQTLGYFDQPHFIKDFKSQIGRTPTRFAAYCRAALS